MKSALQFLLYSSNYLSCSNIYSIDISSFYSFTSFSDSSSSIKYSNTYKEYNNLYLELESIISSQFLISEFLTPFNYTNDLYVSGDVGNLLNTFQTSIATLPP